LPADLADDVHHDGAVPAADHDDVDDRAALHDHDHHHHHPVDVDPVDDGGRDHDDVALRFADVNDDTGAGPMRDHDDHQHDGRATSVMRRRRSAAVRTAADVR
jgi:hypothetical protein